MLVPHDSLVIRINDLFPWKQGDSHSCFSPLFNSTVPSHNRMKMVACACTGRSDNHFVCAHNHNGKEVKTETTAIAGFFR